MSTLREISLLKQLDTYEHPNIVRLLDICHGKRLEQEQQLVLFLVFEHVEQDLASYLERCTSPDGLSTIRIMVSRRRIQNDNRNYILCISGNNAGNSQRSRFLTHAPNRASRSQATKLTRDEQRQY